MRRIFKGFFLTPLFMWTAILLWPSPALSSLSPYRSDPFMDVPDEGPAAPYSELVGGAVCTGPIRADFAPPYGEPALCRHDVLYSEFAGPGLCTGALHDEVIVETAAIHDPVDSLPPVPVVVNNSVESFIKYFQTSGRDDFEKWLARTGGYRKLIEGILRREGLPEELFYVAMIESGLNPRARSRRKAVGLWQFIRGTAKRHGLRVDWWVDERMDPEKSTVAAARYLKRLYERFDSWYLAMAGYNAGEGRVRRALKRYRTGDFWKLVRKRRAFRRETKRYVPKYLAAMLIAEDPERYGFNDIDYAEAIEYEKVRITGATDLKVIARAAGISVRKLKKLNPALRRWFTPPDGNYEIKLPRGRADLFRENFAKIPRRERLRFHKHRVKPGDTLWAIARRYRTSIRPIMYLNNLKNPRRIRPGRLIVVPVRAGGKRRL